MEARRGNIEKIEGSGLSDRKDNIIDESLWKEMILPDVFSGEVRFNEPMKDHTYLRIGGPADVFVSPQDMLSLERVINELNDRKIPFMTIGGGTNLLVNDGGIAGAVISLSSFKRSEIIREERELITFFVESGMPLQRLVSISKDNGYSGIEGLVGIPGSVGGAVAGNAGAFNYSIRNAIASARVMHADKGVYELSTEELGLGYRTANIPEGTVILGANIKMRKDIKEDVVRRIEKFFKEKRERQPLSEPSAGCVFKNPEGTSAGKLIDEAGCKGMRIGDVEVSRVHANFLINKGNAKASDFIRLMDEVRGKVHAAFGINLEPEIRIAGRA